MKGFSIFKIKKHGLNVTLLIGIAILFPVKKNKLITVSKTFRKMVFPI